MIYHVLVTGPDGSILPDRVTTEVTVVLTFFSSTKLTSFAVELKRNSQHTLILFPSVLGWPIDPLAVLVVERENVKLSVLAHPKEEVGHMKADSRLELSRASL